MNFDGIKDLAEIHEHGLAEIKNFFATYKMLEGKETHVKGWHGARKAGHCPRRGVPPHGPTEAGTGASQRSIPTPWIARWDEENIGGNGVRRRNRTGSPVPPIRGTKPMSIAIQQKSPRSLADEPRIKIVSHSDRSTGGRFGRWDS